jgi:uncharacterized membrane protein YbhN (UPF0104 family)
LARKILWTLAGSALGALWLWLALRNVEVTPAFAAIREAHSGWLIVTAACGLGFMVTKGQRWLPLVARAATVSAGLAHRAVWAGSALNLLLAHAGELLRAGLVARSTGAPAAAVLATIAVERIFDFAALAMLCALALLLDARVSASLGVAAFAALGLVALGMLGMRWLTGSPSQAAPDAIARPPDIEARPTSPISAVTARARAVAWVRNERQRARAGLQGLAEPGLMLRTLVLSLLQWGWIVGAIAASGAAVGAPPPPAGALAVFALMIVGLTLPAAPAQVGTTQLAYVAGFALVGLPGPQALAASLVYTGCVVLPQLIAGGVLAIASGTRISLTSSSVPDP